MQEPPPQPIVVDTNVFSYIFNGDSRAERYRVHIAGRLAILSFQTVAEVWSGAYYRNWGVQRRRSLANEIRRYVVVPYHAEMADIWARIVSARKAAGRPLHTADAWIAATALWAEAPIVTHDHRDFGGIDGLVVITERDL